MELLLYIFGNWCVALAALLILRNHLRATDSTLKEGLINAVPVLKKVLGPGQQSAGFGQEARMIISRDLQIALTIGTFARLYWSCSPPPVWSDEELLVKLLCWVDLLVSPVLWGLVLVVCRDDKREYDLHEDRQTPIYFKWPALCLYALVLGWLAAHTLPDDQHEGWPLSDTIVMFNMIVDAFAMVPQMYLILYADARMSGAETPHFIGLLCVGRLLRMTFWLVLLMEYVFRGSGHYLWTFIIPDGIHTILMGDYLYLWLKKVKQTAEVHIREHGFTVV